MTPIFKFKWILIYSFSLSFMACSGDNFTSFESSDYEEDSISSLSSNKNKIRKNDNMNPNNSKYEDEKKDNKTLNSTPLIREATLSLIQPLPLQSDNEESYPISGTCDSSLGQVTITIGQPYTQKKLDCKKDNSFLGTLDVRSISSNPATIRLNQNEDTEYKASIINKINTFKTKWKFPKDNYSFTLPLKESDNLKYNFIIDWGDGSPTREIQSFDSPQKNHIYKLKGEYILTIKGICEGFQNGKSDAKGPHSEQLLEIINLGSLGWKNLSLAFAYNNHLTNVFGGDLSETTNISGMFISASQATPNTSGWDTSQVTDMSHMFYKATEANPKTTDWDTSQVTNMSYMFYDARLAQPDTENWDTSQVTDISHMFYKATEANPKTTDWDTSQVTDMSYMFYEAFNASPDTLNWETLSSNKHVPHVLLCNQVEPQND